MGALSRSEMEQRGHPVWAEIDLQALRHNVAVLDGMSGDAEVMGVVKGYAYGHGNPASAEAIVEGGATRLGVARVAEALHLREAGIEVPVHVFTEPPPEAAPAMVEGHLTATAYTRAFAESLSESAHEAGRRVPVHLKLDTGMHRVGVPPDEVLDFARLLKRLPGIEIEGVWTHLAVADIPDHPFTRKQLDLFNELLEQLARADITPRYRHAANSAATLSLPEAHFDLVRPGIACYGLWPSAALAGSADLRAALSLRARVNMVKEVPAGEGLSYGLTYELRRAGRVVTVPAGYADGYDRRLSQRADVLMNGRRFRLSGTVCMDQFLVDAGEAGIEVGEVATLLGRDGEENISAEELAGLIGTINYEVTSRIPSRVPRLYVEDSTE